MRYIDLGKPVADHPINRGLVAWWLPLPSNKNGSRWFDLKGRYHGTLTGVPATPSPWNAGCNGLPAFELPGTDDVYVAAAANPIGVADSFTICVRHLSRATPGAPYYICVRGQDGFGNGWSAAVYVDTSNRFNGAIVIETGDVETGVGPTAAATLGVWHDVAFTWNRSTGGLQLYLDGGTAATATSTADDLRSSTFGFGIGSPESAALESGTWGRGLYQEVAVYTRVLSASEVYARHRQAMAGYPDLLRRWSRGGSLFSPPAAAPGGDAVPQVWAQYRRRHAG